MGKINLNTNEGQARLSKAEIRDKRDALLAEIDADLLAIPGADNAGLKVILEDTIKRQKKIIRALSRLL